MAQRIAVTNSDEDKIIARLPEEHNSDTETITSMEIQHYSKLSHRVKSMAIKDPVQHSEPCSGASSACCSDDEEETNLMSYYGQPSIDLKATTLNHTSTETEYVSLDHSTGNKSQYHKFIKEDNKSVDSEVMCKESLNDTVTPFQFENVDESENHQIKATQINQRFSDKNNQCCLCSEWTLVTKCLTINSILIGILLSIVTVVGVLHFIARERTPNSLPKTESLRTILTKSGVETVTMSIDWNNLTSKEKSDSVNLKWVNPKETASLNTDRDMINVREKGIYLFILSLNIQEHRSEESTRKSRMLICLKNNRSEEKCKRISLNANHATSVSIEATLELQVGDFVWVTVFGANHLYRNNAGNYLIITKLS